MRMCVCGDERDVHVPRQRGGTYTRGACTNTRCRTKCTQYQEAQEAPEVDPRQAALERIARAIASEAGGWDAGTQQDQAHWRRAAAAVLDLLPQERIVELFPPEVTGNE